MSVVKLDEGKQLSASELTWCCPAVVPQAFSQPSAFFDDGSLVDALSFGSDIMILLSLSWAIISLFPIFSISAHAAGQ